MYYDVMYLHVCAYQTHKNYCILLWTCNSINKPNMVLYTRVTRYEMQVINTRATNVYCHATNIFCIVFLHLQSLYSHPTHTFIIPIIQIPQLNSRIIILASLVKSQLTAEFSVIKKTLMRMIKMTVMRGWDMNLTPVLNAKKNFWL